MAIPNNALSTNGSGSAGGVALADIKKTNVFTTRLPTDQQFPTPSESHAAPREKLGPRMVKGALYTYVRPEKADGPELLAVSRAALRDIGLRENEPSDANFLDTVSGNKIYWDEKSEEGIYPWAQCYGGDLSTIAFNGLPC